MSTRIDDGHRGARQDGDARLDEDDDWFAPVRQQAVQPEDPPWEDELEWEPEGPEPRDRGARQAGIALAVVAAAALALAGFLLGRMTTGSDTTVVTVTSVAQAPETSTSSSTTTPTTTTQTTTTQTTTTPTTTTPTTSNPATVPTDATLRPGTKGSSSVAALQSALTTLGYAPGAADGNYGATTTAAVTAFQTANDLNADGVAGPETLAAVNEALVARG